MIDQSETEVIEHSRQQTPPLQQAWIRAHGYYQRKAAAWLSRRPMALKSEKALISFSFDDFPRSALYTGGEILNRFGAAGTYYACLGMMGTTTATGKQFVPEDVDVLLSHGHELGCHTYSHCHSWDTDPQTFEEAVMENQQMLHRLVPDSAFKTFSYPISPPRPQTKVRMAKHFAGCRGGGQTLNQHIIDLNHLRAFFLEKSSTNLQAVKDLIDYNRQERGWLIFATHDVDEKPTPYGVIPEFFETVVRYAVDSGTCILTVADALKELRGSAEA